MIYELNYQNCTAKIDSLGAQLLSFHDKDTEYIWQRNPSSWDSCAPILFPVVGKSKQDTILCEGKAYPMPMHGFAKDCDFSVAKESANQLVLTLSGNTQTKIHYPYEFCLSITFTLTADTLTTEFKVQNTDSIPIYFTLGGHPGFRCPLSSGEAFDDYMLTFSPNESLISTQVFADGTISSKEKFLVPSNHNVVSLTRDLFEHDALIFESLTEKRVSLSSRNTGRGILFTFHGFSFLGVWTRERPYSGDFLCLEPWQGMGSRDNEDAVLSKRHGVICLPVQQCYTAGYTIRILSDAEIPYECNNICWNTQQ